eukprot:SAG22_NODE_19617_length_273_cov_0.597701_2_plen_20_part_01
MDFALGTTDQTAIGESEKIW